MQRTTKILAATILAGGVSMMSASGLLALPGGELIVDGSLEVTPSTLEPGDAFEVRNADDSPCFGEVSGDLGGMRPGAWFVTPDAEGNWSVDFTVPENGPPTAMGEPTPFPPGDYEIHAFCDEAILANGLMAFGRQAPGFQYEPFTVTVVAASSPTPTPTPTPTPAPTPAAAPRAAAAAAAPTFTG